MTSLVNLEVKSREEGDAVVAAVHYILDLAIEGFESLLNIKLGFFYRGFKVKDLSRTE